MKRLCLPALLLAVLTVGCINTKVAVSPELSANAEVWQLKRSILDSQHTASLGPYEAEIIKQSVRFFKLPSTNDNFVEVQEHLIFNVFDSLQKEYQFVGKRIVNANLADRGYYAPQLEYNTDLFTANIFEKETSAIWKVNIPNAHGRYQDQTAGGYVCNNAFRIDVRNISQGGNGTIPGGGSVLGYELLLNKRIVGTVITVGKGEVWVHKDLESTQKSVVVTTSLALLLRKDLNNYIETNTSDSKITRNNQPDNIK